MGIEPGGPTHTSGVRPVHPGRTRQRIALSAIIAAIPIAGLAWAFGAKTGLLDELTRGSAVPALTFVGSESCADCHRAETALWQESQHKHAMQHAKAATVLGNFDNSDFDYHGVHSRFFKEDDKFFVETDGRDGR